MDFGLRDKIVVVTGASMGIGFPCAQAFAHESRPRSVDRRSMAYRSSN
jgi:NAD(P)-dependent dehydrogenase (short-subunit alcohol dehydrogenase family)